MHKILFKELKTVSKTSGDIIFHENHKKKRYYIKKF